MRFFILLAAFAAVAMSTQAQSLPISSAEGQLSSLLTGQPTLPTGSALAEADIHSVVKEFASVPAAGKAFQHRDNRHHRRALKAPSESLKLPSSIPTELPSSLPPKIASALSDAKKAQSSFSIPDGISSALPKKISASGPLNFEARDVSAPSAAGLGPTTLPKANAVASALKGEGSSLPKVSSLDASELSSLLSKPSASLKVPNQLKPSELPASLLKAASSALSKPKSVSHGADASFQAEAKGGVHVRAGSESVDQEALSSLQGAIESAAPKLPNKLSEELKAGSSLSIPSRLLPEKPSLALSIPSSVAASSSL